MIRSLITSLILTLIIEITVSFILGIKNKEDIKVIILANICTNPVVVYIANCVSLLNSTLIYWIVVAVLEASAVIVEFIIFRKFLEYNKISPFVVSLINNTISFGTGLIINFFR